MNSILHRCVDSVPRWGFKVAVALTVCFVASAGMAMASSPVNSQGVITGCVSNSTGAVRVVDAGASCNADETSRAWNQLSIYWMGTWGQRTSYGPGDAVEHNDSPWVSTGYNRNSVPAAGSAAWTDLMPAGLQGLKGNTGPQGNQGPTGVTGTVTAQSAWYDTPAKTVPNTNDTKWTRIMTMKIAHPGPYTVFAKLVFEEAGTGGNTNGGCELVAGSAVDNTNVSTDNSDGTTLQLNVSQTFTVSDDTVYVACEAATNDAWVFHIKITAINTGWPYYAWK